VASHTRHSFAATISVVVTMAPRISRRLIEAIVRFDDRSRPIAETYRRVGAEAERLGLTRPSYQRIRELVHEARSIRRAPSAGDFLRLALAMKAGNPGELIDSLRAVGVRPLPQWGLASESPRPP
jgi:hypothetical protein